VAVKLVERQIATLDAYAKRWQRLSPTLEIRPDRSQIPFESAAVVDGTP
jgi:hypothetical protein